VILDCVRWTIRKDYDGDGDHPSTARTIAACRTACINNRRCTAIDWHPGMPTGSRCWLVGPWTYESKHRPGIQRHIINRKCGQQQPLIGWLLLILLPYFPLPLPLACRLRSKMKRKIWYFYPTNTTLVAFCPILNLVCLYFLYGPGYLDDGDADRRDILHDGRAAVCPRTSFSAFGGDIFRCHQMRGYEWAEPFLAS